MNILSPALHDGRKVWKKVNSVPGPWPDALHPVIIKKDGVEISAEMLPDVFNDYFTNITTWIINSGACSDVKSAPHVSSGRLMKGNLSVSFQA